MQRFPLLTLVVVFACWCGNGSALGAGAAYRVEVEAPQPLARLLQAELDIVRFSNRAETQPEQLELLYRSAPAQIRALLEAQGYFHPLIDATLDASTQPPVARFHVTPGPAVHVTRVKLDFKGGILSHPEGGDRIEKARSAWPLKEGAVFRQGEWEAAKAALVREIAQLRYASAALTNSRARIDPAANTAEIEVEIDSGPGLAFGAVEVRGTRRYPPSIVVDLNPIPADAPYSDEALNRYQRRLLLSGYFASALVVAKLDAVEGQRVPIEVAVIEAQAQRVEVGIGYSTDKGPRGFVNHTHRNINDAGWKLVSSLQLDRLTQKVSTVLETPRDATGLYHSIGGRFEAEDIQSQQTTKAGLGIRRNRTDEFNESALALQLEFERLKIGTEPTDDRHALFLNQSRLWNRMDDFLQPREGYAIFVELGGAVEGIISTQSFLRFNTKANWLLPLGKSDTILLRGQVGLVGASSREGIPSTYLFRTGGDTTVRGFAFESLGVQEDGAVTGGRYLAIASAEYVHWLSREWGAAAFIDAGNAVDNLADMRLAKGYGAGVRWSSTLGALNLDIAHGVGTGGIRVHFTMGMAFK